MQADDANALVRGLEELLRRTLGRSIPPHGPRQQSDTLSDASQLETALVNLAINSRDAMPDGGHLTIATANVTRESADAPESEAAAPGEFVAIRVSDTGSGMSQAVIGKAFEPFFTTKPIGQGTGDSACRWSMVSSSNPASSKSTAKSAAERGSRCSCRAPSPMRRRKQEQAPRRFRSVRARPSSWWKTMRACGS